MMKSITLSGASKSKMPVIGLGTWQATTEEVEDAVLKALDIGYRHIDTAFNYNNEEAIGSAISKWIESGQGSREDLFITTKLPHVGNRAKDVSRFLEMSLKRLKFDYIDLYLIHLPFAFVCDEQTLTPLVIDGTFQIDAEIDHVATWKSMEEQVEAGKIKNIGLSNFNASQIERVYSSAKIKPSVLQVELHAYIQQRELRRLCQKLNIAITAYSPLGSPGAKSHFISKYNYLPDEFPDILSHPTINELVEKHNKTAAQILLRHLIQQDIIVIPKSSNLKRIAENFSLFDFELIPEDTKKLDSLDKGDNGRIFNFFFFKGVEKHPEYPFKELLNVY